LKQTLIKKNAAAEKEETERYKQEEGEVSVEVE